MQNQFRGRSLADRLVLIDEVDSSRQPSYFEWQEQTITTKAFKPSPQAQSKANSLVRLFRRFASRLAIRVCHDAATNANPEKSPGRALSL